MAVVRVKMSAEEFLVIFLDIACSGFLQEVVAAVHESAQSFQGLDNHLSVGDDRLVYGLVYGCHEVVGYGGIYAELHLLRVNEHKLQLVGVLLVEQ